LKDSISNTRLGCIEELQWVQTYQSHFELCS